MVARAEPQIIKIIEYGGRGRNVAKKYHNTCLYSKISKIKPNILCLHIERQTTNHPTVHIIFADDLKQILKIQLNVLCLHTETLIPWQQQFSPLSIISTNHLTHVFIVKYQILSSNTDSLTKTVRPTIYYLYKSSDTCLYSKISNIKFIQTLSSWQ